MVKFICLFMPSLLTLRLQTKNNKNSLNILDLIYNYTIYTIIINIIVWVILYFTVEEPNMLFDMAFSISFSMKYLILAVLIAIILPLVKRYFGVKVSIKKSKEKGTNEK